MSEADDTFETMHVAKKKWKVITAYYSCYNALYSILMRCGIKCEIHDCSLNLMFLINGFKTDDVLFLESLKDDRINVQYYLKDIELNDETFVKAFVFKCKHVLNTLNQNDIECIRKKVLDLVGNI
ncbi:hypothetical protein GQ473_04735 [archaeon]|nr:hypothetical protein [archaeon]